MQRTFETPGPISLDVRIAAGAVRLEALQTNETEVAVEPLNDAAEDLLDRVRITLSGSRLAVDVPEQRGLFRGGADFRVHVRLPKASAVHARTASADVEASGSLGAVEVSTASGDVVFEHAREARARTASGDVRLSRVDGRVEVNSASGDVEIDRVGGDLTLGVVSGDIRVGEADASVRSHSVSGDQQIDAVVEGEVRAESVSGDVTIGIRSGSRVQVDATTLSGSAHSELELSDSSTGTETGPLVEVRGRTVSGDFRLIRARSPQPAELER
jgi:hypothetical protein